LAFSALLHTFVFRSSVEDVKAFHFSADTSTFCGMRAATFVEQCRELHTISREVSTMKAEKLFSLAGRTALITGAASGLGLAIAEVYCANGAQVALLDIDGEAAETQAARLRDAGHQAIDQPIGGERILRGDGLLSNSLLA
jgi:hypothetical protein